MNEDVIYRARPHPTGATLIIGLVGLLLLFSLSTIIYGVVLLALAAVNYRSAELVITRRSLRVRRSLLSGTRELQLAKLESVEIGAAIGGAKPVSVIGSGGTRYALGVLPRAQEFRDQLEAVLETSRAAGRDPT